jgi:phosphoglycolate phosphatase
MTTAPDLLRAAEALLLDFDGPVADLMPSPTNAQAADRAREPLAGISLPAEVAETSDHLAVLRFTAEHHHRLLAGVHQACTEAEAEAARIAEPSAHAADLLDFGVRSRVPVAVVSNNADAAVREFFGVHGWMPRVGSFACRTLENVRQMKPDPYLLLAACTALGIRPARSVFVGDSVSDVTAGHACDMPVIGIAKNAQRAVDLIDAGAHAVVHLGDRGALLG